MLRQYDGGITMYMGRSSYALVVGLLLLAFGRCVVAGAQESGEVPKVILSGLDAYKAEGPEAAVKVWIQGSAIEGSKDALSQANLLREVQDYYGAYKSFDVIRSRNLSPTTRIIYIILDYEKGPLFARFVVYRVEQRWILVSFTFNTKLEVMAPESPW
jgi:hypothetical protein